MESGAARAVTRATDRPRRGDRDAPEVQAGSEVVAQGWADR